MNDIFIWSEMDGIKCIDIFPDIDPEIPNWNECIDLDFFQNYSFPKVPSSIYGKKNMYVCQNILKKGKKPYVFPLLFFENTFLENKKMCFKHRGN